VLQSTQTEDIELQNTCNMHDMVGTQQYTTSTHLT